MRHLIEDLEMKTEIKDKNLVVTFTGEIEKLQRLEKKLQALHTLMEDCDCCC